MDITAKVKSIKVSPRKVRLVVDLIRNLNIDKALEELKFINKKVAITVIKLIKSGIANAEHNYNIDRNNLYIKEIRVGEGKTLKRWMPRAHGRATTIRKRMSHVDLVLSEIKDSGIKKGKNKSIDNLVKLDELSVKDDKNK